MTSDDRTVYSTARPKGVKFSDIVLKHALRNALIAPFTVIMLQPMVAEWGRDRWRPC
jgi:ABC-type dipeptide/oligopeptide/nickel transport system permease component